jgi:hypothetical protein
VVLDPTGFAISTRSKGPPALAFDGENSLVVWEDWRSPDGDIYGARVTPAGAVLDPAGIAIADAADREFRPTVAFDGGNFLVVWNDCRSSYDIYGARVTPAGVVLDSAGIPISTAASDQFFPVVACDGENFLVVWQDNRGGGYYDIYGARVTRAGVVLDTTGIVISTEASFQDFPPAVAFDGGNFLVAWQDPRSGSSYDIYGARVTPAGGVLDSAGFAVSTAVGTQWCPALAFDGTNFLVVWTDGRSAWSYDIYGARVTPAGTVLDSKGIAISTAAYGQDEPDVAFDGTNFLAVWEDERTGGAYDIYGARVTTEGVVLDSEGIAISTGADYEGQPVLAFDGENFLVVWQDRRSGLYWDIYGARVTPAGVVLDSTGIAISTAADDQVYPALAFDGGNLLVVWFDGRCGNYDADIYGARVTPAGVVLDPNGIAISTEADYQVYPALAFDGDNFLVAWQDQRGGGGHDNIYGARVTPEGVVLDPDGISVSTAVGEQRNPVPIFDSENFLVVWETNLGPIGIYGARVTPAGVVLDSTGITISTATDQELYPALAFDGENSLVVWQDSRGGSDVDLYRARVRPDGTVFDKGLVVSQEGNQSFPALARGSGDQMFLVYQGWVGTVGDKSYNTQRIWGKLGPFPGIGEAPRLSLNSPHLNATIVRGVLLLKESTSTSWLLDVAGRKVLDLAPGANDVRGLAPGVYFVREAQAQAIQKVVLAR